MKLFAPERSSGLAARLAARAGVVVGALEEREFEDGEFKIRPLESVRDEDVWVYHTLSAEPGANANDKLLRLLFLIGALKDAGAARVSALVPYLAFARKDRRTKSRDPITTRYVAQLFEAVGTDRIFTADVHNVAAFENAFRIQKRNVTAAALLARHISDQVRADKVVVVSPDAGGMKRAHAFAAALSEVLGRTVPLGFVEKYRSEGRVTGTLFAGDVDGAAVLIVDDMITSGGTVARAAAACRDHGAASAKAIVTHGLFNGAAADTLRAAALESVVVTDTVDPDPRLFGTDGPELVVLDSSELFAPLLTPST